MELRRSVTFERPIDAAVHDLLTGQGARPHGEYPLTWPTPSAESFSTIAAVLTARGVEYSVFYEFEPGVGDDPDDLAGYLGLSDFTELDTTSDLVMAYDERTGATIVSGRTRKLLAGLTSGLTMDPLIGHDGFFVVTVAPELPDPVLVPRAMFMSEANDGSWAVQSDGRELLTATNRLAVRDSGYVHTTHCAVDGRVLPWRRTAILSGTVLAELREVQGIVGPPTYLGHTPESS